MDFDSKKQVGLHLEAITEAMQNVARGVFGNHGLRVI